MHAMESLIHLLSGIQNTNVGVEGRQNGFLYQSHFCEENIYCLVRDLLSHHHELSVWGIELFPIFISSQSKATPIWHQKAGNPVCWDYHVILYVTETNMRGQGVILDFDTTQPFCTPVLEYIMKSFRPDMGIKPEYQQLLKVFSASEYLDYFASDRSHMLNSQMPFPPWPVIRGSKATISMNLMQFVDMSTRDGGVDSVPGLVMTIRDFLKWTRSR